MHSGWDVEPSPRALEGVTSPAAASDVGGCFEDSARRWAAGSVDVYYQVLCNLV